MFLDWFAVFLFTGDVLIVRFHEVANAELLTDDNGA